MPADPANVPPMTKADIRELRKVADARFKLLSSQIHYRQQTLLNSAKQQLLEEREAEVKEIDDALKPLRKKLSKIIEEFAEIEAAAKEKGVTIKAPYLTNSLGQLNVEPANVQQKLHAIQQKLYVEAASAHTDLEMKKLEITESLCLGMLETEAAKNYMDQIPKAEELLPAPEDVLKLLEEN